MQNVKCKMKSAECKVQNEKCKVSAGTKINRRSFIKFLFGATMSITSIKTPYVLARELIKIGLLADRTGFLANYGYWNEKVVRACVKRLNGQGGITGRNIDLVIEDTKTDPKIGRKKMLKLILSDKVDFIIGSQSSGVSIACNPKAREQKTIHFPLGEATKLTGEAGNRYSFKLNHTTLSHAQVAHKWAVDNLGKKWFITVADYSFGHAHAEEWPPLLEKAGGEVLGTLTIPTDAKDFLPYLGQVDQKETEVLLNVFPGTGFPSFIKQAHQLGLTEKMEIIGPICSPDGMSLDMEAAEGSWWISNYPRLSEEVPESLWPYDHAFREAVGVNDEGREIGNIDNVTTGSHYWYGWSILFLLKEAIEKSGWESKEDDLQIIEALEGIEAKAGPGFPQGDAFIRDKDHQGFHDHYIERVEGGKLRVKKLIDKEKAVYSPKVDYTK